MKIYLMAILMLYKKHIKEIIDIISKFTKVKKKLLIQKFEQNSYEVIRFLIEKWI